MDGGDAKTGLCAVKVLGKDLNYEMTNDASVQFDNRASKGNNAGGDQCGDIKTKGGGGTNVTVYDILVDTDIPCNDQNNDGVHDGVLKVSLCNSWKINGKDGKCNPKIIWPSTSSKCHCGQYNVTNIKVNHPNGETPAPTPPTPTPPAPTGPVTEQVAPDTFPTDPRAGEKPCLEDLFWGNYVSEIICAASSVEVDIVQHTATMSPPGSSCVAGEKVNVTLSGTVKVKKSPNPYYNLAWFVATDGGDALSGSCQATALPSNGGDIHVVDYDDNSCGDLIAERLASFQADLLVNQEVKCATTEENENRFLAVSICFSWQEEPQQSARRLANGGRVLDAGPETCDPTQSSFPGFARDCDCDVYEFSQIRVEDPIQSDPVPAC